MFHSFTRRIEMYDPYTVITVELSRQNVITLYHTMKNLKTFLLRNNILLDELYVYEAQEIAEKLYAALHAEEVK